MQRARPPGFGISKYRTKLRMQWKCHIGRRIRVVPSTQTLRTRRSRRLTQTQTRIVNFLRQLITTPTTEVRDRQLQRLMALYGSGEQPAAFLLVRASGRSAQILKSVTISLLSGLNMLRLRETLTLLNQRVQVNQGTWLVNLTRLMQT